MNQLELIALNELLSEVASLHRKIDELTNEVKKLTQKGKLEEVKTTSYFL